MSIHADAAKIILSVSVDIDTMKPDLSLEVEIQKGFEFLQNQRGVLASWLRTAAKSLADSNGSNGEVQTEEENQQ